MNIKNDITPFTLKHIFQKSSLIFIIKVFGLASGFVFTFLTSRFYGAELLGIISICISLAQVVVLFTVAGFDSVLLKTTAQFKDNINYIKAFYKRIISVAFLAGLCITIIIFCGSEFLATHIFSKPGLKPWFMMSSVIILPATCLLIHASGLRGLDKTGWFSFFRETSRYLFAVPLVGIMIVFFSGYSSGPLLSYSIAVIIAALWSSFLWWHALKRCKPSGETESVPGLSRIFSLAMPFFFITVLAQLSPLLNPLILGIKGTTADVGVFNVALRIAGLLSLPLMIVNMATATSFAGMKGDHDAIRKTVSMSTKLIFWTSLPMLVLCLSVPGKMMSIFGSNFETGSTALIMIAMAQFINAITGSTGVIMQMTGHEKPWGIILFCTTILNIILILVLVPLYGINGAAFSTMVSIILNNIAGAVYLKRKLNIRTYYFPFLPS